MKRQSGRQGESTHRGRWRGQHPSSEGAPEAAEPSSAPAVGKGQGTRPCRTRDAQPCAPPPARGAHIVEGIFTSNPVLNPGVLGKMCALGFMSKNTQGMQHNPANTVGALSSGILCSFCYCNCRSKST